MKWREIEWWFINLASRPDRNAHAEEQFAKHNLPVKRFEAFTPDQWDGDPAKIDRMMKRTPGAVGCWMSQVEVIRKVAGTDRVVGVCEDDICFCDDLHKRLRHMGDHLPEDWHVAYLGATFHVPGVWCHHPDCAEWGGIGRDVLPTADPHILQSPGIWGTYGYLVNGRHAHEVLDALDNIMPDSDGIDHAFIRIGTRLNTYCFVPGCCWQLDGESNIGTGITEFSGFKKLGPYVWTDRMEDFDPSTFDWEKGTV